MDWSHWNEVFTFVSGLTAGMAAVGSICFIAWRRIKRTLSAISSLFGLHERFGETPHDKIWEMLDDLRSASTENEILQKIITTHLRIGLFQASTTGSLVWANDELCKLFGLDSSRMLGYEWLDAVEDRTAVKTMWDLAVEKGIPYTDQYVVVNASTGERFTVRSKAYCPVKDGTVLCYIGVVTRLEDEREKDIGSESTDPPVSSIHCHD